MDEKLIGKCGFYCGACSTYIAGNCLGCEGEHDAGDCFTRDCVTGKGLRFCGECRDFPCDDIIDRDRATVLDRSWLEWKRRSDTNR